MDKALLRQKMRALLATVPLDTLEVASSLICDRLTSEIDWSVVRRLHLYQAQPQWNEINLQHLVNWVHSNQPGVVVTTAQPRSDAPKHTGERYDCIIVPLLGFDSRCNRLGRGSGWYDSFLSSQSNARTVGVALELNRVEHLPTEPHDVPLQAVVTERTVYRRAHPV